jgi:hypothetical protein
VVAYGLWALSLALWCLAWLVDVAPLGQLALIVCGGAATATVRTYFVVLHQRIRTAMSVTATVQEGGVVRPMR